MMMKPYILIKKESLIRLVFNNIIKNKMVMNFVSLIWPYLWTVIYYYYLVMVPLAIYRWATTVPRTNNQQLLAQKSLLIVFGSGGHTTEMLLMLASKEKHEFDFSKSKDGGVHFGSKGQADMRAMKKGQVVEADIDVRNPMRSRDTGGNWKDKIKNAKSKGHDSIQYLNRYEGVNLDTINKAQELGIDLDRLTDSQFRKFVKEAQDSYIVFDPKQIKILGLLGK